MSSRTTKPKRMWSAAWRISLWATLAFAFGTMMVFLFLHRFVANDVQRRSDAWLSGEVEVLGDVAERTPRDALYDRVVKEVAELASKEVPNRPREESERNDSVFFLQTGEDGALRLWVGSGDGRTNLQAIQRSGVTPNRPSDLRVEGFEIPFRVASIRIDDGSHIYLGLSERDELLLLRNLRLRFIALWLIIVVLGFAIVFYSTRRMLGHVRSIAEVASTIGESDVSSRVPISGRDDEVSQLALTLNHMLDRIERSMHQLHTITDSLAHDLRSPLTAIRGKLEMSLSANSKGEQTESIISAVEELDRITEFLNQSRDVAEGKADALKLHRQQIDLNQLLEMMIDLYEPSMTEQRIHIHFYRDGAATVFADAGLVHRMIANLFDNEIKHLPQDCTVDIRLHTEDGEISLMLEDDGPGFAPELAAQLFEQRVRGAGSHGHGLGLAFVAAVVRAHGGMVTACNRPHGGAQITLKLPLSPESVGTV